MSYSYTPRALPLDPSGRSPDPYYISRLCQSLVYVTFVLLLQYLRMNPSTFEALVVSLSEELEKMHTNCRQPLSVAEQITICLRFLATGESAVTVIRHWHGVSELAFPLCITLLYVCVMPFGTICARHTCRH